MSWVTALGYFTGLHLINPSMDGATLLRTAILVHTCDAIMCRLLAHNSGRRKNVWTGCGFLFGIWALTILMLLPSRKPAESTPLASREETPRIATDASQKKGGSQ